MNLIVDAVFVVSCAVIVWSGFCRLNLMSVEIAFPVRVSIWAMTVSAFAGAVAVLFAESWRFGIHVTWPAAALAASAAAVWVATGRGWKGGAPAAYRAEPPPAPEAP